MSNKFKSLVLAMIFMATLTVQPLYGQSEVRPANKQQKSAEESKGSLSTFPNNRKAKGCYPAEVTFVNQGGTPPEAIEVVIKNFQWKVINAVKLGWYIAEDEDRALASRIAQVYCDAPPLPDQIILSGETPLIEVSPLHPQQSATIGQQPLKFRYETVDRVILTDYPLITMDELKGLTIDENGKTFKKKYALILGVSEIQFADGSVWRPEGAPTPLTPSAN